MAYAKGGYPPTRNQEKDGGMSLEQELFRSVVFPILSIPAFLLVAVVLFASSPYSNIVRDFAGQPPLQKQALQAALADASQK